MDRKTVEHFILSFPSALLEHPFGEDVAVYTLLRGEDRKMFALIAEGKTPVRLSLKCDPALSKILRDKYIEVMPGHKLHSKYWNTLVLSGQLEWDEVRGLIRHSYDLVATESE